MAVVGLLGLAAGRGPDGARLNAELAQRERVVGAELDRRTADERQALAPRMLEQVAGELVDDVALDALEAPAVLGAQIDEVLAVKIERLCIAPTF